MQLTAAVENERSRSVAERLGMTQEGVLRKAGRIREDRYLDLVMYSMLREEWRAVGRVRVGSGVGVGAGVAGGREPSPVQRGRDQAGRQRQPVRHQPVREGREHGVGRGDAREVRASR